MNKIYSMLIAFLLFSIGNFSNAQSFDSTLAAKLQNKLDSMRLANNIKGISASVIYPGQGMWQGTSGVSYGSVPITRDMEFGIASNTKLFTAVALLKLIENNIVNLDDSLHKWLPTFTNVDSNITIRQILNHVSGIEDVNNYPGFRDSILANPNRIFTPYEVMRWVGSPLFPPGTDWSYSNTNYLLAGMVFESASGQNIARFLRDSILTPLQLDSTFFDVQETVLGTIAHPWQNEMDISGTPRIAGNSAAWTAGAMYSNSSEMVQWYNALMNNRLVINSNSFNEMTTFVGSGNYGFGIGKQTISGRTVWAHGGNIIGYRSQMLYDITLRAIVCVLTNSNPAPVTAVATELLLTIANNPVTEIHHDPSKEIPQLYSLYQNFPNPFNPTTTISYQIPEAGYVSLKVYDMLGKEVATLINEFQQPGYYVESLNGSSLPSGIYFYRIQAGQFQETRKLVLLK